MAHFAELDENNKVIQVIVVHNNELLDDNGNESEQKGIDFCVALLVVLGFRLHTMETSDKDMQLLVQFMYLLLICLPTHNLMHLGH